MKKRTIVILCVVGGLFVWFVIFLNNSANDLLQEGKDYPSKISQSISDDYINLLKEKNKISIISTTIGKFRSPISDFYYDKKYCVEVYKVDSSANSPLKNIAIETQKASNYSSNAIYTDIEDEKTFYVRFLSRGPGTFKKLYINMFGGQTKTVLKNDSMLIYHSIFKNFSLKTQQDGPYDIYVQPNKMERLPFEVIFSKKAKNIYMVLISAKLNGAPVDTGVYKQILNL